MKIRNLKTIVVIIMLMIVICQPALAEQHINFYENYDNDDYAITNPTESVSVNPIFVNNTLIFEAAIVIYVTDGGEPASGVNVSLKIWNSTYQKIITTESNDLGHGTFLLLGPVPSEEYQYHAYITDNPSISTETRKINICQEYEIVEENNKSVTLEKMELIINEEGGPTHLRVYYSVTSNQTMDDNYTITAIVLGNTVYDRTEAIHLEANIPKTVYADIPVDPSNLYQTNGITFELQDPLWITITVVVLLVVMPIVSWHAITTGTYDVNNEFGIPEYIPPEPTPVPPVPELQTVVLFSVGLIVLAGFVWLNSRKSKKR